MAKINYMKAISEAIGEEMERDPNVVLFGEDVFSGVQGTTAGLGERFGKNRILDMPISEAGFTGMGIGAAMKGLRPIVEYMINTLQYVSMEMLVNQAAKLRYMTGGQLNIPLTVLVDNVGGGTGGAAQHSDSTWAQLIHMGLKVVVPSCATDMKGLLKAAIREDDPVVVYTPGRLLGRREDVPEGEYLIPLGKGALKREGQDLTIVAVGHLVPLAMDIAEDYATNGVSIEVIDPRTLYPLDKALILDSVKKTGRLLICDDGYRFCSFSSEVAAIAADECFAYLKAPVKRVTRPMTYVPYSKIIEQEALPNKPQIAKGVTDLLRAQAN